jgi:uncharacterized membrane protein (UPF0127 family)
MLFSIDVVFLDGNQVVIKVVRNLKPGVRPRAAARA